jgi:hypothetical protein
MNTKYKMPIILGLFVILIVTSLIITKLFRSSTRSLMEAQTGQQLPNLVPTMPAPAFNISAPNQEMLTNHSTAQSPSTSQDEVALLYDEQLSFQDNLQRLNEFCRSHQNDPQLEQLLGQFETVLFKHAKGQFAVIEQSLNNLDGTADYRNILLNCLMVADGTTTEKADIVWQVATDQNEPIETRRMATSLIPQLADGKNRSDDLLSLLNDSDRDMVMLALIVASSQMDERTYNFIKTSLLSSKDINIQIAAVDAIGHSAIAGNQTDLLSIIGQQQTSSTTIFSNASLLKRRAISYLDLSSQQAYNLTENIALNPNEDPSVRAAAITKLAPSEFPQSTNMLLGLLQTADSNDAILLVVTEDSLLTTPTPNIIQAIQTKAAELPDPQLRNLMIQKLNKITNGAAQ